MLLLLPTLSGYYLFVATFAAEKVKSKRLALIKQKILVLHKRETLVLLEGSALTSTTNKLFTIMQK